MNANELKRNEIKTLIEKNSQKHGGYDDVTIIDMDGAHPSNRAGFNNCWEAVAVKIEMGVFRTGVVRWDFETDMEDPSDQNWDFDTDECHGFYEDGELDMDDEDDLNEAIVMLVGALK